ncbi:hypothetical protein PG996_011682 [Apiospora saccharicola]|uniref:Uncharacterized protein n=1 Tax=Apiospora saccharicola TaxID=335842 RepID=A0ABR1UFR0_9PEZI
MAGDITYAILLTRSFVSKPWLVRSVPLLEQSSGAESFAVMSIFAYELGVIRWQPATLRPPTKVATTPETALDKLMITTTMARQPALDLIVADVVDTVDDAEVDEDAMEHTGDIMLALRQ